MSEESIKRDPAVETMIEYSRERQRQRDGKADEKISKSEAKRLKQLAEREKERQFKSNYSSLFEAKISEIWFNNVNADYIIHVGKTGSGKTYNAIKRLKEVGSGHYLAPLRLLAWEVYEKFNAENIPCSLVTGEEQLITENAKVISSTIEMMDYSLEHEVVVIDESFMISDSDRGNSWTKAILNAKAKEIHIIVNDDALDLIQDILTLTNRKFEVKRYEMLQKFRFTDHAFNFHKDIPNRGVFVTFSRINVLINRLMLEKLGKNVSVLYGNLPPEVKKRQIQDFIDGKTDLLVTTDVIGMGINIPCDYVVFMATMKFDGIEERKLNPLEIRQIAGRTGRYGLSGQDAFVSASDEHQLRFIKNKYDQPHIVDKAYFGMDYDMFSAFPEGTTLVNRIRHFKDIDFIPAVLKHRIRKESTEKYTSIAWKLENKKWDLKTKWIFLTAPVKQNNEGYFDVLIKFYDIHRYINLPTGVENDYDIKGLEDHISKIELYLNLTRHLQHDKQEKESIMTKKQDLIELLNKLLLDKKLATKKKCKLCSTMLEIASPYGNCYSCYQNKIRNSYDDDYWNY